MRGTKQNNADALESAPNVRTIEGSFGVACAAQRGADHVPPRRRAGALAEVVEVLVVPRVTADEAVGPHWELRVGGKGKGKREKGKGKREKGKGERGKGKGKREKGKGIREKGKGIREKGKGKRGGRRRAKSPA